MDNNQRQEMFNTLVRLLAALVGVLLPHQLAPPLPQLAVPHPDNPEPRRAQRTTLRDEQRRLLEQHFRISHNPGVAVRQELARQTGLAPIRVREWFSNRRGKWRRDRKKNRLSFGLKFLGVAAALSLLIAAVLIQRQQGTTSLLVGGWSALPHSSLSTILSRSSCCPLWNQVFSLLSSLLHGFMAVPLVPGVVALLLLGYFVLLIFALIS
ncbi:intestine-specific homeobox-like [Pomacea canaliculata]|uniref:intestine-specific homeobox-like n=1 Tax=Pomacea canaliculata TaxID=400727 RepID=UPI000D731FA4|nr:intestine-specific homeobox-like [Pomacea canaliculata]